ncbi:hypothetical protein ACMAY8_07675 [Rhodobacteraceae bacterium nBUS_22]
MSLFDKSVALFENKYDPEKFRELHHEEFMFIRETQLVDLDEQCEIINGLAQDPEFHPLRTAELVHENHYALEFRWEDNGQVITNLTLKKDGLYWRTMVSRIPKAHTLKQKM